MAISEFKLAFLICDTNFSKTELLSLAISFRYSSRPCLRCSTNTGHVELKNFFGGNLAEDWIL